MAQSFPQSQENNHNGTQFYTPDRPGYRRMQIPAPLNPDAYVQTHQTLINDMNSATGFDFNYSSLLPSQLLLGSPFQTNAASAFSSPHYSRFQSVIPHDDIPLPINTTRIDAHGFHAANTGLSQFRDGHISFPAGGDDSMVAMQPPTPVASFPHINSGTNMSRTIYLGNLPTNTTAEQVLSHVRSGAIESVRMLPEKNCAFVAFLDAGSATHFYSDAMLKKMAIRGQETKVGWGKPSPVPHTVNVAVQQAGASRNVYLGNLPKEIDEASIRNDLENFGAIDTIKLVREKNIAFVHFLSINSAIKTVAGLPQQNTWGPPRRISYGKDRCAYISKTQQQNAAQYLGIAPSQAYTLSNSDKEVIHHALAQQSVAAAQVATAAGGLGNLGNRTIYLGNIHPETTTEEICNVIRGGLLHNVRYIPDKHICFVTFIDPNAAASFYMLSQMQGVMIHNRRLKIGWGKHSGPLPPAIAMGVSAGASRNVYIGNLDESWNEERLRQDFSEFGEIELVNTLREKSCAFVNFTNIANAIKSIEAIRDRDDYKNFKINFGKDRCGNAPRQGSRGFAQNALDSNDLDHERKASQNRNVVLNGTPVEGPPVTNATRSLTQLSTNPSPVQNNPSTMASNVLHGDQRQSNSETVENQRMGSQVKQISLPSNDLIAVVDTEGSKSLRSLDSPLRSNASDSTRSVDLTSAWPVYHHYKSHATNASIHTLGGFLAPANIRTHHSRAISLPVFGAETQSFGENSYDGRYENPSRLFQGIISRDNDFDAQSTQLSSSSLLTDPKTGWPTSVSLSNSGQLFNRDEQIDGYRSWNI